jgi:hypothetical protein
MQNILRIAFLTFLASTTAHARLGETEEQTVARYGPVAATYNPGEHDAAYRTLAFNKNGYLILTAFMGPTCEMVCFRKEDKSALGWDDLDFILKAESQDRKWLRSNLVTIDVIWDRDDGAIARYDTAKFVLAVFSVKFEQAEQGRLKSDEQRKLESF